MGDKQSCKKLSTGREDSAFEAKDLENDVDYEQLSSKISKIEKVTIQSFVKLAFGNLIQFTQLIGTEHEVNNELQKKIQNSAATMNQLRMRIDNMVRVIA